MLRCEYSKGNQQNLKFY